MNLKVINNLQKIIGFPLSSFIYSIYEKLNLMSETLISLIYRRNVAVSIDKSGACIDLQWFARAEDEGRTEEASEHKIRKAREEGRVAKSQELNSGLVLLFSVLSLIIFAPWIFTNCVKVIKFYFDRCAESSFTDRSLVVAFFIYFIKMILPIAFTAIVAGIAGNIIQNKGFLFSTKPIEPKFSKILPKFGEYFRKTLFSFEGLFNVAKSIIKVTIIIISAYLLIKNNFFMLKSLINMGLWQAFSYVAGVCATLLLMASIIFIIIAVPDYFVQRHQFMESLKMTKQEVKEEFKELEGDPLVKSRLRQRMHEMMHQSMPRLVAEADVVITNPTHFACAIQYDKTKMPGPMLTAKGADSLAQRIKEIAKQNDVPIIENRPLARALYKEVEIGDIIPEEYYQALAVILAKVYNMNSSKHRAKFL
jgi:flagellar biosynthetic protein FlhB